MKTFFLLASVSLNIVLVCFLLTSTERVGPPQPDVVSTRSALQSGPADTRRLSKHSQLSWAALYSTNLFEYVQNLRRFGFPQDAVNTVILAEINKLFANQEQPFRFLLSQTYFPASEVLQTRMEARLELLKLQEEKNKLVHQVLGFDLMSEESALPASNSKVHSALKTLPEDKRARVAFIVEWFDAQQQAISEKPFLFPNDRKALAEVEASRQKELSSVLTTAELQEFGSKTSKLADHLRMETAVFKPTEEEFKEMYRIKSEVIARYGDPQSFDMLDQSSQSKIQAASGETESKIKTLLGRDRYLEYKRAQDWSYQTLVALLEGSKVPIETINEIYGYKRAFAVKTYEIEQMSASPEEKKEAKVAYSREVAQQMEEKMGKQSFIHYRMNGGNWLDVR